MSRASRRFREILRYALKQPVGRKPPAAGQQAKDAVKDRAQLRIENNRRRGTDQE